MTPPRFGRRAGATAALAVTALGAGVVTAPARVDAPAKVTANGVGAVHIGDTFKAVRKAGAVGALQAGCELAGPSARSARLRQGIRGNVDLTTDSPRTVSDIQVFGGATARGVGVGDSLAKVRKAFPKGRVVHSTEGTFGVTLVRIPKNGGGRITFALDADTHRVTVIGVPIVAFCE